VRRETTQVRNARKKHGKFRVENCGQRHFTFSPFNTYLHTLATVKQFDYLGLRLDPMMTMTAAVASIQEKAHKGHSLAIAASYSFRYDKHHSNPALCHSLVKMLNLWKSCVLPHFLLYPRYISDASQVQILQPSLNHCFWQAL